MILKRPKVYYITENETISNQYFLEEERETTNKARTIALKNGYVQVEPLIKVKGVLYCPKDYKDIVIDLIREKYCVNDEIAIIRQKETKPSEFAEYNTFVEDCKCIARVFISERKRVLGK